MVARAQRLAVCLFYLVSGPSLIMLNKHIMQKLDFRYPITLSALGMIAASVVSVGAAKSGAVEVKKECLDMVGTRDWFQTCIPVGLCKAATLTLGTASYLYLNMGFIQMLKSFSPVVVMATAVLFKLDYPRSGVCISVFVICVGTAITTGFDPSMNWQGLLLHIGAATTEAVNLVLTQFLLQNRKFSVVEAQCVLAPPGVLFLMLSAWFWEWPRMYEKSHHLLPLHHPFLFFTASFLGLLINYLTFYVIQATSSLTLKILGMFRNIALIFIGMVTYQELIPGYEAVGFCITVLGFGGYNYYKANPQANLALERRVFGRHSCSEGKDDPV